MITRIVKMRFEPEHTGRFEKLFHTIREDIRSFPGCHEVKLVRHLHDPALYFTISRWTSEEHLNHYRHSAFFDKTWQETRQMFADKPEAWSVEEV